MELLFFSLAGVVVLAGLTELVNIDGIVYVGWKRLRILYLQALLRWKYPNLYQEPAPVVDVIQLAELVASKPVVVEPTITKPGILYLFEQDGTRSGFNVRWKHGAVIGKSGSGKGNALQLITLLVLTEYAHEAELWVIDRKNGLDYAAFVRFPSFKLFRGRGKGEKDETLKGLLAIEAEMERRLELLFQSGCRNIDEYNRKRREQLKYLVLICDEIADFEPRHKEYVETFAALYRACGLVLIVSTQHPLVKHLSSTIQSNLDWRFVFKVTPRSVKVATNVETKEEVELNPSEGAIGRAVRIHNGDWTWVNVPELTAEWRDTIIDAELEVADESAL